MKDRFSRRRVDVLEQYHADLQDERPALLTTPGNQRGAAERRRRQGPGHDRDERRGGRVEKGQSPGHVSVIFALQSALYHLPLASALSAYIWFEFQSGLPRELSRESLSELSTVFEEALVHVATAVRESGGPTGGSGNLRVV